MTGERSARAHLITGGFPPGSLAGHDHDYARLRLLGLLAECNIPASVANDFSDVEKWLPVSRLLITYVAGPYPDATQCHAIQQWLEEGGHWLGLHGTSGGRAERVEGFRQRRTVKTEHHAVHPSVARPMQPGHADMQNSRRCARHRSPDHARPRHVVVRG